MNLVCSVEVIAGRNGRIGSRQWRRRSGRRKSSELAKRMQYEAHVAYIVLKQCQYHPSMARSKRIYR